MLQNALILGYDDDSLVVDGFRSQRSLGNIPGTPQAEEPGCWQARNPAHSRRPRGSGLTSQPSTDKDASLFLEVARNSGDDRTIADVFAILEKSAPPSKTWRETALGSNSDKQLAALALALPPAGDQAARSIGRMRSALAVRELEASRAGRRVTALNIIQQEAGSLPGSIPREVRFRLFVSWVLGRLSERPERLLVAYGWIVLGVALSAGLQVFLTYRLPQFMDTLRILSSVERGGIFGLLFGLGILAARVTVERFPESKKALRVLTGVLLGTFLLSAAVFVYDVFLNEIVPSGFLLTDRLPGDCARLFPGRAGKEGGDQDADRSTFRVPGNFPYLAASPGAAPAGC